MRAVLILVLISGCGGGGESALGPHQIDVLALTQGSAAKSREITVIASDGNVQKVKTDGSGHAIVTLGDNAVQATAYFDTQSAEGRYTMQGVVPGDHVCLGCAYSTSTTCPGVPTIANLVRSGGGWSWQITGTGSYAGMVISWKPGASNPNGGGRLVSPPGETSASTDNSADITIELLTRDDVASYAELKTLSKGEWDGGEFCANTAHK